MPSTAWVSLHEGVCTMAYPGLLSDKKYRLLDWKDEGQDVAR